MDPISQPIESLGNDGIDLILNELSITDFMIMRLLNKWWHRKIDVYASGLDIGNVIRLGRPIDCLALARIYETIKNVFLGYPQVPICNGTISSIKNTSEMIAAIGKISSQFSLQSVNGTRNDIEMNSIPNLIDREAETKYLASQFPCWLEENSSILLRAKGLELNPHFLFILPLEILALTNIQTLHLRGNLFFQFPVELCTLTNLCSLTCSSGAFRELPVEIGNSINLRILNLNFGRLEALPPQIGLLTELRSLLIHSNRLSALPPEISSLTNLTCIDLNSNKIEEFPLEMLSLTNLSMLLLQGNRLESIPWGIDALTKLFMLNIANNKLSMLPLSMRTLPSCHVFYSGNSTAVDWMGALLIRSGS